MKSSRRSASAPRPADTPRDPAAVNLAQLRGVFERLAAGVVIADPRSGLIWWNPAALAMHDIERGRSPDTREIQQQFELATTAGVVLEDAQRPLARALRGENVDSVDLVVRRRDRDWVRTFNYSGSHTGAAGTGLAFLHISDITARRQAEAVLRRHEAELERLNRLYRTLLRAKRVIAQTPGPRSLFIRICQSLTDDGGFGLAWVGWCSEGDGRLVPLAAAGDDDGYAGLIRVYTDGPAAGHGPAETVLREGRPHVSNDARSHPEVPGLRAHYAAHGFRATAAFPIRVAGAVQGVLSVYAREADFFREQEVALLEEVVAEASLALEQRSAREEHGRIRALAEREQQLSGTIFDGLPGIVYLFNQQGRLLRWNRNFGSAGYPDERVRNMHPLDFFRVEDRPRVLRGIQAAFEQGELSIEADYVTAAGEAIPHYFAGRRLVLDGETCIVGMGVDISQRRRAEAAAEEYARQLQATARRLLEVQEAERRNLARELHDAVGQELTALSLNLTVIGGAMPPGADMVRERLEDSMELLEGTTRHLRNMLVALRPPGLDELGLLAALKDHAGQVAQRAALQLDLAGTEPAPRLDQDHRMALFRIAQEAMHNTVKHAQATRITLRLSQAGGRVTLSVADDGLGFDPSRRPPAGTYGLGTTTMRERAAAMGATLRIAAAPGAGTRVELELPWPPASGLGAARDGHG